MGAGKHQITFEILSAFGIDSTTPAVRLSGGHINDTYLVENTKGKFILQRINHQVFPSPDKVMENVMAVTAFLREKLLLRNRDPQRETLTFLPTTDGKNCFQTHGEYWRCMLYIDHAAAYETAVSPEMLYEAGQAFGTFQNMLSDYPAETLHEIIPNFHNTPVRFCQLKEAVKKNISNRVRKVSPELDFAFCREQDCRFLMDLLRKGKLPLRVTHNDTKMSNVLLDQETGRAVCVIDLDTVMPGLAAFDFGDSIRTGASTAAEDERDLSKVCFDLQKFEAYASGFLATAGSALTQCELETLSDGVVWMTYETGIRFLTDYLNGDVYFRTAYPEHNLDRARNQFQLTKKLEQAKKEMDFAIQKICNTHS